MIYRGSRYEYSTIDFFSTTYTGVEEPVVFYKFSGLGYVKYWEHVYVQGERLDQIAHKYYQRPQYWWIIPEYNPEILDFNNIEPGTVLRIPNV
jgi:nucleoid-associated protein YgaU